LAPYIFWLLAGLFALAGIVNVFGLKETVADFKRWRLPQALRRAVGATELVVALALIYPPSRGMGLIVAGLILCAATSVILAYQEWNELPAPLIFAACFLASTFTYL
jgi:hypothetical protein